MVLVLYCFWPLYDLLKVTGQGQGQGHKIKSLFWILKTWKSSQPIVIFAYHNGASLFLDCFWPLYDHFKVMVKLKVKGLLTWPDLT